MSLWLVIAIACYAAVAVFLLATLIVQEATQDDPDWASFWVPVLGSILWGPILLFCVAMLLDDTVRGLSR